MLSELLRPKGQAGIYVDGPVAAKTIPRPPRSSRSPSLRDAWKFQQLVDKLCASSALGVSILADEWLAVATDAAAAFRCGHGDGGGVVAGGALPPEAVADAQAGARELFGAVSTAALEKVTAELFRAYAHRLVGSAALAHNAPHPADAALRGMLDAQLGSVGGDRQRRASAAAAAAAPAAAATATTATRNAAATARRARGHLLHLLSHNYAASTARWNFGSYPRLLHVAGGGGGGGGSRSGGDCVAVRLNFVVAAVLRDHGALEVSGQAP